MGVGKEGIGPPGRKQRGLTVWQVLTGSSASPGNSTASSQPPAECNEASLNRIPNGRAQA